MNVHDCPKPSALRATAQDDPLRRSGLAAVGDVPWGTHMCQFYSTAADLLETLVPYFKEGLESNEFCMWVTSDPLGTSQAKAALARAVPRLDEYIAAGQIEILNYRQWYRASGRFDPSRVRNGWLEKLDGALKRGFDGLRLTGDTFWLSEEEWEHFIHYEARLDPVVNSMRILAICTYSLEKCPMPKVFDAIANHEFALMREEGRWEIYKSFARHRTEQAVRESEARLRATIEGASDGIITMDAFGDIVLANSAASRMFGYASSELIGQNIRALMPAPVGDGRSRSLAAFLRIWTRKSNGRNSEGEGRRRNGSLFPIEWTMSETLFSHQRHFVAFVRNLTEQRKTEAQMRKLHADRLNALGGMATALMHEINQPLAATVAYLKSAQRLLEMPTDQRPFRIEHALDGAASQAMRAGRIIGHMREFVARGEPNKTVQNLHELIEEACALAQTSVKFEDVRLIKDFSASNDRVLVDKIQIEQVIVNLKRNAIEAMRGSKKRELVISTTLAEPGMIRTDIVDTGPGLSEELKERLFEPFATTKANGMGVGLSISRAIIEAHYGIISAASNPGGGAVFSFTLPLMETGH
jgi:two-component system sensor kinase FixL